MSYTPKVAENQKRYRASEKGSRKHREYMRDYMLVYRERRKQSSDYDPEVERRKWREQHQRIRESAIEQLGGKRCANCGCDELNLLETNHVNGGGRAAAKIRQNRQLYRDIVKGRVELSDYNVLCRVCNALHYIQEVLGVKGHGVTWRAGRNVG
ncbi:MAG TPA: hypothetical protein VJT09_10200 [Pyrinomonadaceae bacterium]|nr:hypothetical protein [Pyrinomonadaceae bacterium]